VKHRWRVDQNYLLGITAGQWRRLLRENGYSVDPAYWHRAAVISGMSVLNSIESRAEERRFGPQIDRTVIEHPPLFILGHWRTGTTLLHNLISRDPRFAYPNLYEIMHPGSFLSKNEASVRRWAERYLPEKRPMDNMAYGIDLPQEDEFALAVCCLRSPEMEIHFARRAERYRRYLTFEGVPDHEVEEWKRTFLWFLKKLTVKYRRPLVLKSPPHTARIRRLLEVFPEARFVNLHREPYTAFQSARHAHDTAHSFMYLQKPDHERGDDVVLATGRALFDAYFDQRHLIPPGRLVDVAFEDLEARPVAVVQDIYERLALPDFEAFRPQLQAYVDSLGGYRKNRFPDLAPDLGGRVAASWRRAFEEWGYPVGDGGAESASGPGQEVVSSPSSRRTGWRR
jgi:omega-hydroxy-beta-dihydromenaquinone-9 sulfotransferase